MKHTSSRFFCALVALTFALLAAPQLVGQTTQPTTAPATQPAGPVLVTAVEGEPVFVDSGDPKGVAAFQVVGGSLRYGHRTGYAFPPGTYRVLVTPGRDYEITVAPAPAKRTVAVRRGMTQSQVQALIAADTILAWDADAVTVLTTKLEVRHPRVTFLNAKLSLRPTWDNAKVGVWVRAAGFVADRPTFTGDPAHTGTGRDNGSFGSCAFSLFDGGSLVVRDAKASRIDSFLRSEGNHRGEVVERPVLSGHLAYALYANDGDAGVSWIGGSVRGVGNEPFFRVIDNPSDPTCTANFYVGLVDLAMPARNVGKDGITPRDCWRFSADRNVLANCQIRSGQDAEGVRTGGSDPRDVLIVGNRLTGLGNTYIEHKVGGGRGERIHVIGNSVDNGPPGTPGRWSPPIAVHRTRDSFITGNVHVGGAKSWSPMGANTNPTVRGNGNTTVDLTMPAGPEPEPEDPQDAIDRARLLKISARLTVLDAEVAAGQAEQAALRAERAAIQGRLGLN